MVWLGWVLWHINHCRLFNAESFLYIQIKYIFFRLVVFFGCVLLHINHCRLFNAEPSLYIYMKYIWFVLVWFSDISTIVGYLMPNPLYTYISNIYGLSTHFLNNSFKRVWAHCFLHIVKWCQVLLNNIYYLTSVICLDTFKYVSVTCYTTERGKGR